MNTNAAEDRALGLELGTATVVLFCFLTTLCEGIDLQAAGVASPGIRPEFMPSPSQLSYFFSASTFGLVIGAFFGGRLADWVGRKTVLVSSITVFGLLSLLTVLGWDMRSLTGARFLTGLGLGGALPNLVALVAESSPEHRRSANVGMVYAGMPTGGAIASLISLIIAPAHWRWIFVAGGVAPLIIAPLMALLLPESAAFRALQAAPARAIAAAGVPLSRVASVLRLFGERRALRTLLLWVSFFLALLTLYLLLSWLPTMLVANGLSKQGAAIAQIAFNVGGIVTPPLVGWLLEGRLRHASVIVTFASVPILLMVLAHTAVELAPIVIVVGVLGCAVMATQAILYALAPPSYPTVIRGMGVGAAVGMGRLGSVAGPLFAGVLIGAGHSTAQVFMGLVPLVVVGGLCAIVLVWLVPRTVRIET